jgi:hypothetical protein
MKVVYNQIPSTNFSKNLGKTLSKANGTQEMSLFLEGEKGTGKSDDEIFDNSAPLTYSFPVFICIGNSNNQEVIRTQKQHHLLPLPF